MQTPVKQGVRAGWPSLINFAVKMKLIIILGLVLIIILDQKKIAACIMDVGITVLMHVILICLIVIQALIIIGLKT